MATPGVYPLLAERNYVDNSWRSNEPSHHGWITLIILMLFNNAWNCEGKRNFLKSKDEFDNNAMAKSPVPVIGWNFCLVRKKYLIFKQCIPIINQYLS